jgi:predicted GIY-YIG superfamily endonuclease
MEGLSNRLVFHKDKAGAEWAADARQLRIHGSNSSLMRRFPSHESFLESQKCTERVEAVRCHWIFRHSSRLESVYREEAHFKAIKEKLQNCSSIEGIVQKGKCDFYPRISQMETFLFLVVLCVLSQPGL